MQGILFIKVQRKSQTCEEAALEKSVKSVLIKVKIHKTGELFNGLSQFFSFRYFENGCFRRFLSSNSGYSHAGK